jgi:hypothetical protein
VLLVGCIVPFFAGVRDLPLGSAAWLGQLAKEEQQHTNTQKGYRAGQLGTLVYAAIPAGAQMTESYSEQLAHIRRLAETGSVNLEIGDLGGIKGVLADRDRLALAAVLADRDRLREALRLLTEHIVQLSNQYSRLTCRSHEEILARSRAALAQSDGQ